MGEKRFEELEPDELERIRRMMSELELAAPRRLSRRRRRARRGKQLDLRRTLRSSLRTGGDPMTLAKRRRRMRPRRLVLICDISGSMEPYARAYLHLMTSAVASGAPAEAFVFATRLTRLTRALGGRNPEARDPAGRRGRPRLVQRDADRGGAANLQRHLRAPRHGPRRGRRDPLRRLGARRPHPRGARDGAAGAARPPHRLGQPPRQRPRFHPVGAAAWRRLCRTATRWSAATASTPSTRSPRRCAAAIPPPSGRTGSLRRGRGRGALVAQRRAHRGAEAGADAERLQPQTGEHDIERTSHLRSGQ